MSNVAAAQRGALQMAAGRCSGRQPCRRVQGSGAACGAVARRRAGITHSVRDAAPGRQARRAPPLAHSW